MDQLHSLCHEFAKILNGKSEVKQGICSVSFYRNITVFVQGKQSKSVVPVEVSFESLDQNGYALNLVELAILQEEIPKYTHVVAQQGIIVSGLHNHWIYMEPMIFYIHLQSVEPPLHFARKIAHSFSVLNSYPISKH